MFPGMTFAHRFVIVTLCIGLATCGSDPSPSAPASRLLQVGGSYQITKTGQEDTCGGPLTPFVGAGAVAHTPGAGTFLLSDSFTEYRGNVSPDGTFTVAAQNTAPHQGAPVVTSFQNGRFAAEGFNVQVRLDIDGPRGTPAFPACFVAQSWRGVKQGSPNVIP